MADVREAFGAFVVQGWAAILFDDDGLIPGPKFDWPEDHAPVLIRCWKRFREHVLNDGRNGGRVDMVPVAQWVRETCRRIRAADETLNEFAWLQALTAEMCKRRFLWTRDYWWTGARPSDHAWARGFAKLFHGMEIVAPPMPDTLEGLGGPTDLHKFKDFVEGTGKFAPKPTAELVVTHPNGSKLVTPVQLKTMPASDLYRCGHARASHHTNGKAMEKPMRRLAWFAYHTALENRALRDSVRLHLGSLRE